MLIEMEDGTTTWKKICQFVINIYSLHDLAVPLIYLHLSPTENVSTKSLVQAALFIITRNNPNAHQ